MDKNETLTCARTQVQPQVQAITQPEEDERLLGDLSFAQVTATALASATSFALSNQIGIAGSLIGAAVGAAASVVAGQVYKQLIKKSQHKLESLAHRGEQDSAAPVATSADATSELHTAYSAPARRSRWAIVAALLAAALLALGIYTAIVNVTTEGAGIGTKPQTVYVVVEQPEETDETPVEEPTEDEVETTDASDPATTPEQTDVPADTPETPTDQTTPSDSGNTSDQPADTTPADTTPADNPQTEPTPTDAPATEPVSAP